MKRSSAAPDLADRMARECVAVRVRLINRVVSAIYDEALRPFSVRITQVNILSAVSLLEDARPAVIARILRIEKSTLSRDVELMKKHGWIQSDPPAGGRNQTIRLTADGRKLLTKIEPAWEHAQAEAKSLIGAGGESAIHEIAGRLGFAASAP
jgi:DNA-binding MarR family transcriptional regulator